MDARVQRNRHHAFLSRFWRLCHKLLRLDLALSRYKFSFVSHFLLELEALARIYCGASQPLHMLLYVLASLPKPDLQKATEVGCGSHHSDHGSGARWNKSGAGFHGLDGHFVQTS